MLDSAQRYNSFLHCDEVIYTDNPLHAHLPKFRATVGGSAGIGKAAAQAFDANGCSVAVLGRRLERLEAVVSLLPHNSYSCLYGT